MSNTLDKVPAHVLALAAKIETALEYDAEGHAPLADSFFAEHVLPDLELTEEQANKYDDAKLDFANAVMLAHGNKSTTAMAANKDLERTTAVAKAGRDEIRASFDRKVMVRAPGSTEEKAKYGQASLKLTSGVGQPRGDYKRIKDHLNENATSVFGG